MTEVKPKGGQRPALIDKVDLVSLIWDHATLDKSGRAEGFSEIMGALLVMKSFRERGKDEKYVKRYLEGRMRRMMGEGIPLPVFTDIPVEEKPKSQRMLAIERAQAAMKAAGVSPELIGGNADEYLGLDRRSTKAGGRRSGDS